MSKPRILDGRHIRPGDAVLGLASNGLHTNGYSLARQVLFDRMKLTPRRKVAELGGPVGEELLRVHRSYCPLILPLLKRLNRPGCPPVLKGMAHITGGGFVDNLPRILPARCDAVIDRQAWEVPAIFRLIQEGGKVAEPEMYQVFNMGVGMALIVEGEKAAKVLQTVAKTGQEIWRIGEIVPGTGECRLV